MTLRALGLASFGAAALAWLLLGILLASRRTPDRSGHLLLGAISVQTLWAGALVLLLLPWPTVTAAVPVLEAVRPLAWIGFLLHLLGNIGKNTQPGGAVSRSDLPERPGRISVEPIPVSNRHDGNDGNDSAGTTAQDDSWRSRRAILALAMTLAAASIVTDLMQSGSQLSFALKTLMAVTGLVCVEQVYRNAGTAFRWGLKHLVIALAGLFAFDLLVYSEAMLFLQLNPAWWIARGFANALLVPLVAIAAARNPHWRLDAGISRAVVFHSAALFAAGLYLLAFAAIGYYVRFFGGQWGEIVQSLVLFGATLGLVVILASGTARARLRVFLAKNFFSYRFDYRDQWLRLTRALTGSRDGQTAEPVEEGTQESTMDDLPRRALLALAETIDSNGGAMWLRDGDTLHCVCRSVYRGPCAPVADTHPLIAFLTEREWIIDLPEWHRHRDHYDGLELPEEFACAGTLENPDWQPGRFLVPLMLDRELLGFVLLGPTLAPTALDWEVRDLLKAAARQAASYLGVQRAVERLVQAQQFESFNRMSAFVVHDLKNLVAQLSLMMRNAQRHRDNPEFQADMLATVENVMERMQGLLLQLRTGARPVEAPAPVALAQLLQRTVRQRRQPQPEPVLEVDPAVASGATVPGHADRLERVIGHLLQNAADATGPSGMITVRAATHEGQALIEIEDNGTGMSEEFIRTGLFRPFASTKAHGMGIGVFESREYVRELGGSIEVDSSEGRGTTFRVRLPLADTSPVCAMAVIDADVVGH